MTDDDVCWLLRYQDAPVQGGLFCKGDRVVLFQDGDEFDPQIHEALMHETSADVTVATASKILQPGYKFKERVLRPARVAVTDPE